MSQPSIQHDLLQGALRALAEDLTALIPEANGKSVSWDQTQLMRLVLSRGTRFLTIDLPEFGKHFDACLDNGSLIPTSIAGFSRLRTRRGRDSRPRLLWAFLSRVFKYDGSLRTSPCANSIWAVRLFCRIFAKFKGECDDAYKYEAIREFYAVEMAARCPDLDWDDVQSPFYRRPSGELSIADYIGDAEPVYEDYGGWARVSSLLQRVSDVVVGTLPEFDPYSISCRHGPGAVSDGKSGRSKYSFPIWPDKLEAVFPYDWHASTCFLADGVMPVDGEVVSKLICVPKTMKGPRLIAAEPISHQWVQQGIADWFLYAFDKTLIGSAVRIRDQTFNQERARWASTGEGATVDLSSASDRLTCSLVERVFRRKPALLSAMIACRTPLLVQSPMAKDKRFPDKLKIRKFASMGSALTFPVQSTVFAIISFAAVLIDRGEVVNVENVRRAAESVAVYGDDLIVPVRSLRLLRALLASLGLKVNTRKTYGAGKFRESCGADWYNGVDVTPAYIRSDFDPSAPGTISTVVQTSNNFHQKGLWRVADFLLTRLPRRVLRHIAIRRCVHNEDRLALGSVMAIDGLHSFSGSTTDHLPRRYNEELHRYEVKSAILTAKKTSSKPDGVDRLRQYLTETPDPALVWDPRTIGRPVPVYRPRWTPPYSDVGATLPWMMHTGRVRTYHPGRSIGE